VRWVGRLNELLHGTGATSLERAIAQLMRQHRAEAAA
jgi:hypothetical protein